MRTAPSTRPYPLKILRKDSDQAQSKSYIIICDIIIYDNIFVKRSGRFDFSDIGFSSRCLFSIVFRLDRVGAGYLPLTEKCTNHHVPAGHHRWWNC